MEFLHYNIFIKELIILIVQCVLTDIETTFSLLLFGTQAKRATRDVVALCSPVLHQAHQSLNLFFFKCCFISL